MNTAVVSVRIPVEMVEKVDRRTAQRGQTRNAYILELLEADLAKPDSDAEERREIEEEWQNRHEALMSLVGILPPDTDLEKIREERLRRHGAVTS